MSYGVNNVWLEAVDDNGYASYSTNYKRIEVDAVTACTKPLAITRPSVNYESADVSANYFAMVEVPEWCGNARVHDQNIEWNCEEGPVPNENGLPAKGRYSYLSCPKLGVGDHHLQVHAVDTLGRHYWSEIKVLRVEDQTNPPEPAPTITIQRPKNGKVVEDHKNFRAVAKAIRANGSMAPNELTVWYSDSGSNRQKKELKRGDGLVRLSAQNITLGPHVVWVEAQGSPGGLIGSSLAVSITVTPSGSNIAEQPKDNVFATQDGGT